mmetsp:Transcript_28665/g.72619  ORF Transcript_28665/g.72619 Transcript_28665/m.72619 type:complete len:367 (-) Transcript_28665:186-1286(-)
MVLPLVVQVWVALEPYQRRVHAVPPKGVPHPLAHHDANHDGEHVLEAPSHLKHDDNEAHGHPRHAAQHRGGPHDCVDARRDAVLRRHAGLEHAHVAYLVLQQLHREANGPPQERPDAEGGDEDPPGGLVPERDHGEQGEDHGGEDEEGQNVPAVFAVAKLLENVLARVLALGEEGREEAHVGSPEVDHCVANQRREAGAEDNLRYREAPEEGCLAQLGHSQDAPVEQRPDEAAHGADEEKGPHFKELPLVVVGDLKKHQLAGAAEGVEPLQRHCCHHGAEERPPHGLCRVVDRDLLEREEHPPNRRPERHGNARRGRRRQKLPLLSLVCRVFAKEAAGDVCHAHAHVDEGPLLAYREAAAHSEDQA